MRAVQYIGAWLYMIGTVAQLYAAHVAMNDLAKDTWIMTPYFLGGVFFAVGGYLLAVETSSSWTRAVLPPPREDFKDVGRWVQFFNVTGSFLFFVGGCAGYLLLHAPLVEWQVVNGSTFALGSVLFLAQSILLTAEWVYPRL